MIRVGVVHFPSNLEKARFMAAGSVADLRLPEVQRWAAVFRKLPLVERPAAILKFCQYAIDYVRDPRREVLEDSAVTLLRGYGDCDAKARVFVALCRASGVPAREHCVRPAQDFPHILAEVWVNGRWRRVDPTILNSSIDRIPPSSTAITNYW
ncbi:transglutaminase-like domain-containing protein [Polyangium mundeleinium]|uniref:Transglutaminase domain-containing protein n=1 Tax=Polyangium mundeleinium TaxID=2995306 RepID=A0ABT5EIG1_9BACT|nr:transglutaminase domain-containing protein [Polyangium mundeleinium]MDC0740973.1 transglutaminase domain-containing protein [Polyangium mundeleinium]